MMKEIESGKKLRKVETNDRSKPILPKTKAKGKIFQGQTLPTLTSDHTDGDATSVVSVSSSKSSLLILIERWLKLILKFITEFISTVMLWLLLVLLLFLLEKTVPRI